MTWENLFSNYCGLGGSGATQHRVDELCKQHDEAYSEMMANGINPYVFFNEADQHFLNGLAALKGHSGKEWVTGAGAHLFFEAKKAVMGRFSKQAKQIPSKHLDKGKAKYKLTDTEMQSIFAGPQGINSGGTSIPGGINDMGVPTTGNTPIMATLGKDGGVDTSSTLTNFVTPEQAKRPASALGDSGIEPTSGARKKLKMDAGDGDVDMSQTTAMMMSQGGGMNARSSHETPVLPHSPSYGLPETHTVILPLTFWCTMADPDTSSPVTLDIRMNSVWDVIMTTMTTPTAGAAIAKGIFNSALPIKSTNTNWPNPLTPYPTTATGGAFTAEIPAWRDYFSKQYDVYNVMGTHVEITMRNVSTNPDQEVVMGYGYDAYGASSAGNKFPAAALPEAIYWKNMHWKKIAATTANDGQSGGYAKIRTSWKPNMIRHNVTNDQDVQTWTAVGSTPNYTESLHLMLFRDGLSPYTGSQSGVMCEVTVKYVVQFKDLKEACRFPWASATTITQTVPTDALPVL